MPPNHAQHGSQPQPPAGEFGREEGVEDAGQHIFGHPLSLVFHHQADVPAGGQPLPQHPAGLVFGIHDNGPGTQPDGARLPFIRFGGIDDQVHDHLLHLPHVRLYGRQVGHELGIQGYAAGYAGLQQGQILLHQCVQV